MPLTKKEAAETEIVPKDTFPTNNCVISKAMALAERDDKRFIMSILRPTRVLLECRQLAMEPDREPDLEPGDLLRGQGGPAAQCGMLGDCGWDW